MGLKDIPSVSISDLSKYYQFNCEKLLKKIVSKVQKSTYKDKKNTTVDLKSHEASRQRGNKFELDIKNGLNNIIDCQDKSYKDLLREAQVDQIFYQMKFDVPESFYDYVGIKDTIKLKVLYQILLKS
jgi:DNA replication ATP-dependent helicase Dna2